MEATGWSIVLLDHFHLRRGGEEAVLTSRKSIAILAYLATQRQRSGRREALASLLWENSDPAQARISLRQALAAIRRVDDEEGSLLIADGDFVRLGPTVGIDADALSAASESAEEGAGNRRAADAYVTGFLSGFTLRDAPAFNEWLSITQAHYRQRAVAALSSLMEEASASGGDVNAGIGAALRLLSIDTFNEAAVRGLMRLYARQGRAGMALAHYRQFADLLRRELQVAPEAATQTLFQAISVQRRETTEADAVIARLDDQKASLGKDDEPVPGKEARSLDPDEASRLAPVEPSIQPPSEQGSKLASAGAKLSPQAASRRLPLVVALVALVALCVAAYQWVGRAPTAPAVARLRLLVSNDRAPEDISLSPSGERLVFSDGEDGSDRLFWTIVRSPDTVMPATSQSGDRSPDWAADGKSIVFVRAVGSIAQLVVKSVNDSRERVVASAQGRFATPAWSPDGKTIYASFSPPRSPWFRLAQIDAATGGWRPLTGTEAGHSQDLRATPSPDGSRLLFVRRSGYSLARAFTLDLRTGEARPVGGQSGDVFKAIWRPDGKAIIYSAKVDGESALWFLPLVAEAKPRRLTIGLEDYRDISASAAGERLASLTSRDVSTFWTVGSRAAPTRLTQVAGLLTVPGDRDPERNAKGEISFVSSRAGDEQIWLRSTDGRLRQLTRTSGLRFGGPEWSPQGSVLAVSAQLRGGTTDLYLIDPVGGSIRRLTRNADAILTGWSNDGRFLYYRGERRSGGMWRYDVLTGATRMVNDLGYAGMPTPDGRAFIYVKSDLSRVWQRSFDEDGNLGGTETLLLDDLGGSATITGDAMVYLAKDARTGEVIIRSYDFSSRRRIDLARLREPIEPITLAPDGAGGVVFARVVQQRQVSLIEFE